MAISALRSPLDNGTSVLAAAGLAPAEPAPECYLRVELNASLERRIGASVSPAGAFGWAVNEENAAKVGSHQTFPRRPTAEDRSVQENQPTWDPPLGSPLPES